MEKNNMEKFLTVLIVIFTTVHFPTVLPLRSSPELPDDATLDFLGLAHKYGYAPEEYNVVTEDGYILKLFRIPGNIDKPVLLMHGLVDSADTFMLRGRNSLAGVLAEKGYDVWVGNARGSRYSRRHLRLDPDSDKQFWDFSFHEMAVVDLKTFIDFILNENNVNMLTMIGHSQGNTLFYILGSEKPEYNSKINLAIALGPVCFVNLNNFQSPMLSGMLRVGFTLNRWLLSFNEEEIFGNRSLAAPFLNNICALRGTGYKLCAQGLFNAIAGEDNDEFEPDFFYSVIAHYPTSTSRKNLLHLVQVATRNEFAQFDHGPKKNIELYRSKKSPEYDLGKVTMKIAMFVGKNDKLTPLKNVAILKQKLPNVVSYREMERKKFNHIDHVWGKHMDKYLFPHIFKLLERYS